jgi:hypothetical protein
LVISCHLSFLCWSCCFLRLCSFIFRSLFYRLPVSLPVITLLNAAWEAGSQSIQNRLTLAWDQDTVVFLEESRPILFSFPLLEPNDGEVGLTASNAKAVPFSPREAADAATTETPSPAATSGMLLGRPLPLHLFSIGLLQPPMATVPGALEGLQLRRRLLDFTAISSGVIRPPLLQKEWHGSGASSTAAHHLQAVRAAAAEVAGPSPGRRAGTQG